MVAVRDAATVMLLADRPDLQVFVLRRTPSAVFGPGATVFPGGAVDDADHAPEIFERVVGLTPAEAELQLGRPGALAWWVAAVRECFEEAGILLARHAKDRARVRTDASAEARELDHWRDRLNGGEASFVELLAAEDLVIDARDLRLFSHWRTPSGPPRRYDTWFFAAAMPDGQDGLHDDNELVESAWVRPADALDRYLAGAIDLVFPTFVTLETLGGFPTASAAMDAITNAPRHDDGRLLVMQESPSERIAFAGEAADASGWTPLPDITWRDEAQDHGSYTGLHVVSDGEGVA